MLIPACLWAITAVSVGTAPVEPGVVLDYRGLMSPVKEEQEGAKSFRLRIAILNQDDNHVTLGWTLTEKGRGSWTWMDHYGRLSVARDFSLGDQFGPALLWEREDGVSIVPLWIPLVALPKEVAKDTQWNEGRLEMHVLDEQRAAVPGHESEAAAWRVEARSPIGHKRTFSVLKDSPLVTSVRETAFLGQGVQHELRLELVGVSNLTAEQLTSSGAAFDAWEKLRNDLGRKQRNVRDELSAEQVKLLRGALPALPADPLLGEIASLASDDARLQRGRTSAVAALRKEALGKTLGEFEITDTAGKRWTEADLAGKTVVLHFWEYRDSPLEEPYGQSGYLDYLQRDFSKRGVVVLGVCVDPRLASAETRRTAAVSARKFREFMNLSYPVLLDEGQLLKRVGDPRVANAKWPLFVVVGPSGKVTEYHAGLYEVTPQQGLSELAGAVEAAAK